MNEIERERSFPLFFLVSMALHALLFLIAPQLIEGLLPSFQSGEQGGVTLITLVDVVPPEQVRAAVSEAARQPQSRPQPAPNPEPQVEPRQQAPTPTQTPTPQPEAQPVETPRPVSPPTPAAQIQPEPADIRPVATAVQVEDAPNAQPAPQPERVASPTVAQQSRPTPVSEAPVPVQQPVLTSDSGVRVAASDPGSTASTASAAPASPSTINQGESATTASDIPSPSASAEESGTGADQDVTSAAPTAEISPEPALPPTGQSMILTFGGSLYPKDAVGLLQRPVTVKVAAIVSPDGTVLEGIVVDGSEIAYIDEYAYNVATRAVRYRPHSEIYEVSVFVTFDPVENALSYRVADFISVPPTVGSFAP